MDRAVRTIMNEAQGQLSNAVFGIADRVSTDINKKPTYASVRRKITLPRSASRTTIKVDLDASYVAYGYRILETFTHPGNILIETNLFSIRFFGSGTTEVDIPSLLLPEVTPLSQTTIGKAVANAINHAFRTSTVFNGGDAVEYVFNNETGVSEFHQLPNVATLNGISLSRGSSDRSVRELFGPFAALGIEIRNTVGPPNPVIGVRQIRTSNANAGIIPRLYAVYCPTIQQKYYVSGNGVTKGTAQFSSETYQTPLITVERNNEEIVRRRAPIDDFFPLQGLELSNGLEFTVEPFPFLENSGPNRRSLSFNSVDFFNPVIDIVIEFLVHPV